MLRVYAMDFVNLGRHLHNIQTYLQSHSAYEDQRAPLPDDVRAGLLKFMGELKNECVKMDMSVAVDVITKAEEDIPKSDSEFALMFTAVWSELRHRLFLFVPPHRSQFYEQIWNLDKNTVVAFPLATKEIQRAGNCYAFGEYTACVVHAMRGAEIGLRAHAANLNVTFPHPLELADWENLIEKIESSINGLKAMPKGAPKDDLLTFHSRAAIHFRYFKDAWRKHAAHARETYDEAGGLSVMQHVYEFLQTLSARVKE